MDNGDKIFAVFLLSSFLTVGGCIVVNNTEMLANHKFEPGDLVYRKDRPEVQMVVMDESFNPIVKLTTNGETFQHTVSEDQLELWEGPLIPIDEGKPKQMAPNRGLKEGDIVRFKLDHWFAREMVIGWFPKDDAACCAWEDNYGQIQTKDFDLDLLEKVE